jgi:hypothetical protein
VITESGDAVALADMTDERLSQRTATIAKIKALRN